MRKSTLIFPAGEAEMEKQHAQAQGPTKTEQRKAQAAQRHQRFLAAAAHKGRNPALYTAEWQARVGLTETQFGLLAGELAYLLGLGPKRDITDGTAVPTAPSLKLQRNSSIASVDSLLLFWLRGLQARATAAPAERLTQLQVARECGLRLTQPQASEWASFVAPWGERLLLLFLTGGNEQEFEAATKVVQLSPELGHLTRYRKEECYDRNAEEDRLYRSNRLPPLPAWLAREVKEHVAKLGL